MIPDHVVEEVRARADIVEVIGAQVTLQRSGKDFKGLCPFHQERTPSFYVVPAKGFYTCFGCHESGDVFTFLMRQQGLDFQEAVRQLAGRVGVTIPDAPAARQEEDARRPLYEAVAFAAELYQKCLWQEAAGERARRYLEGRGIGREAAERFQLGYAPDDWQGLRRAAQRHGIDDAVLLEAGLTKRSERSDEPYDRLRDRLIFPIVELGGRIVGFGGRVLEGAQEGAPKYLNSPETPLYHKGRMLYGLNWARAAIRREETALVVEGYMDYVSLAAHGIEHVVAGLGTAVTAEQAQLLARYTEHALLLYDSDAAGLRATFRTADALLRAGVHPLVVTLPDGEDPDSVARAGGAPALKPYLDGAVDVLERKLRILEERGYFRDIQGVRKALDGLLPTVRATTDAALRDIYVERVAHRTGVRRETIARELERAAQAAPSHDRGDAQAEERGPRPPAGEHKLLLLLLRDQGRLAYVAEQIGPDELSDPGYRELFERLAVQGVAPAALAQFDALGQTARARYESLMADPEEISEGDDVFQDSIDDIRAAAIFRRLDRIDDEIATAGMVDADERVIELMREKSEHMRMLRQLGRPLERLFQKRRGGQAGRTPTPRGR